jgi:mevalonate kinase
MAAKMAATQRQDSSSNMAAKNTPPQITENQKTDNQHPTSFISQLQEINQLTERIKQHLHITDFSQLIEKLKNTVRKLDESTTYQDKLFIVFDEFKSISDPQMAPL